MGNQTEPLSLWRAALDLMLAPIRAATCVLSPWPDTLETLRLARVGIVVAAMVCVLVNVPQSVECLVVLMEDVMRHLKNHEVHLLEMTALYALFIFLAVYLWYWARRLQYAFLPPVGCDVARVQTPRILGMIPFLGLSIAWLRTDLGGKRWIMVVVSLAFMGLFYAFCWGRRHWLERRSGNVSPKLSRLAHYILWIVAGLALLSAIWFTVWPESAKWVGALPILVSSACIFVVLGNGILFGVEKKRWPIFWLIFFWIALWSFLNTNDNHQLRHISSPITPRESGPMEASFSHWLTERPGLEKGQKNEPYPVVLIACEGGGIYAAYNSAKILCALQDAMPGGAASNKDSFSNHVFAISGVSGGSVGAGLFAGLVQSHAGAPAVTSSSTPFSDEAEVFFEPDFLAPLIAKAVYPDLFQQVLPAGCPAMDRSRALEQSFEMAWDRMAKTSPALAARPNPFNHDLFSVGAGSTKPISGPYLLLNTTEVESGRQIVMSRLHAGRFNAPAMFFDDHPLVHLRLSTAATLSARFPVVTSAGLEASDDRRHRYVDGGYYENSGLSTIADVLAVLLDHAQKQSYNVRFIVIRIGMDDTRGQTTYATTSFGEIGSPIRALLNTRHARETAAIDRIHELVDNDGRRKYVEMLFNPLKDPEPVLIPLGWLLSENAKQAIGRQVKDHDSAVFDAMFPPGVPATPATQTTPNP